MRLFDRIEIGALDVLDDGKFERGTIIDLAHDDRDFGQPCPLRRPPAPLAGDDLIAAGTALDGRTTTGWTMPCSRIDCARSVRSASPKARRGLRGLGSMNSIGTSGRRLCDRGCHAQLCRPTLSISPISAARPRPNRRLEGSSFIVYSISVCFDVRIVMLMPRAVCVPGESLQTPAADRPDCRNI